jgi:chemotaxis response regulator CheB
MRPPLRTSADLLLTSLGTAVGADAIAVVRTRFGHHGAAGASAVKRFSGIVLASDEASSRELGMPEAAIDTGASTRYCRSRTSAPSSSGWYRSRGQCACITRNRRR